MMDNFVAYHNYDRMEYPFDMDESGDFSFYSSKSTSFLEKTVGQRVWVIEGHSEGKRKTYELCAVFEPEQIVASNHPDFLHMMYGGKGIIFEQPIVLNELDWFPDFLKSQSNFSIGIARIHHPNAICFLDVLWEDEDIEQRMSLLNETIQNDTGINNFLALEGGEKYYLHLRRERNATLIQIKKEVTLEKYGILQCEACGFDFSSVYGILGKGFCEVHHRTPLAKLPGQRLTSLDDLAIVCSNCHRMLHHSKCELSVGELKGIIRKSSVN